MGRKPVKTSKKVSRNKKDYWRKGTDVAAVENYKDVVMQNERFGLTTKSNSEIFFIQKDPLDETGVSKINKRVELRCFSNLKPNSAVPAFLEQPRASKSIKRREGNQLKRLRRNSHAVKPVKKLDKQAEGYDLWTNDEREKLPDIPEELTANYLRFSKIVHPKIPTSIKKTASMLQSVEPPLPGQSYNPTFEDHQDLIKKAVLVEVLKEKSERRLTRKLATKGDLATEASRLVEESEGLNILKADKDGEDSDDCEIETKPDITNLPPLLKKVTRYNKKTPKVRRRQLAEKLLKKQRLEDKQKQNRLHDVYRLRSIHKDIKKKEKESLENAERHRQKDQVKLSVAGKLGKTKYEAPNLEIQLSSEISGSMRLMKPEGNLLEDRYKSLVRRNVVESRKLQLSRKRKYALKKYEKRNTTVTTDYVPR